MATTLPSGSVLHRYQVTVRAPERTESVPVSWFDPTRPPMLAAGAGVAVIGRVRRRFYRAGGPTRSATEVIADRVVATARPSAPRRLAEAARAALDEAFDPA